MKPTTIQLQQKHPLKQPFSAIFCLFYANVGGQKPLGENGFVDKQQFTYLYKCYKQRILPKMLVKPLLSECFVMVFGNVTRKKWDLGSANNRQMILLEASRGKDKSDGCSPIENRATLQNYTTHHTPPVQQYFVPL